jgi:hypothetical protein
MVWRSRDIAIPRKPLPVNERNCHAAGFREKTVEIRRRSWVEVDKTPTHLRTE